MSSEFQREYLVRLPLPLAQLYHRAYNDKSAQSRHNNTFYLFEALVKLATAPVVAAYLYEVDQGCARVAELDRLLVQLALPSLGQWVGMLRALARHFGTRPDAAAHPLGHLWNQLNQPYRDRPGLLALFRRIKNCLDGEPAGDQSCSPLQVIHALVPYRNAVFGHGAGRFESFYEREMGPLLFPAANEMLAEGMLDLLGPRGSRLVHIAELRMLDEDRVEVGLRELVGERSARTAPVILGRAQAEAIIPDRVAVLWPGRAIPRRLDPLLLYREREMGDEVLFLNRDRNGRQVEYLSYTRGEPERDRATAPALAALLARVTGRDVGPDQLEILTQQSVAETPSVEALVGPAPVVAKAQGDYEILAEIGRGGMGVVYLAQQLSLGRLVALKMLPADLAGDEVALARFRREMRLLARCDHPNIVKVLASGALPDGRIYYAMEYVPGCDLEQVWRELSGSDVHGDASTLGGSTWARAVLSASRKKRQQMTARPGSTKDMSQVQDQSPTLPLPSLPDLPLAEDDPGGYSRRVAMLVRDAALALQAIHEQQVLHRDIKPANLMLTPDGSRVVLMDFGLAKGQSLSLSASKAGGLLGTLRYAAPEQLAAASLKVGPAADVRGLGVTLWELLTHRRLFAEAEDERQLAALIHDRDVPRLRLLDPGHDPDLEAIVARATERRECDRIETAGQLAEYLQLYVDGKPLPIRPPTTAEMVGRWVGTHRLLVSTTVATTLAILATVVIALVFITRARDQAIQLAIEKADLAEKERKGRIESQSRLANLDLERGVKLCIQGKIDHGLLWLARALKDLPQDSSVDDQERIIRMSISGWRGSLHRLIAISNTQSSVNSVAYRADGRTVLIGSSNGTTRLWDTVTWKLIGEGVRHQGGVLAVAFSPDGKTALTGGTDRTARFWDVETGRETGTPLEHETDVRAVAFSPDGKTALTGSTDGTARLWDVAAGRPIGTPLHHQGAVRAVAFRSDGGAVFTGSDDGDALAWDARTGHPIGAPFKHQGGVSAVALSPDGQYAATGCLDGTARLWKVLSHDPLGAPLQHKGAVVAAAFSPDGKNLLTGSEDGTARLWDTASGQIIGMPLQHFGGVLSVAFSPDGANALTGSADNNVRMWDTTNREPLGITFQHEEAVLAVVLSPDGRTALTGSADKTARLWDTAHGRLAGAPRLHPGSVLAVGFGPDGTSALTGCEDGVVRLWDAVSGQPIGVGLHHKGRDLVVAFGPNGKMVLTGGIEGLAVVWDMVTRQPIGRPLSHGGALQALSISPDGKLAMTGGRDGAARFWDVSSGSLIGSPLQHEGGVLALSLSPDRRIAMTGSIDRTARLWDVTTSRPLGTPLQHEGSVHAVAFSPDGRRALTGDDDGNVCLWDTATGQSIGAPMQHRGTVYAVAFSPDGKRALTGSGDKTARLWELPSIGEGRVAEIVAKIEITVSKFLDNAGAVRDLDSETLNSRLQRLPASGGAVGGAGGGFTMIGD
jgi:WD40 repeat protein/serine/threonine protein kinase